MKKLLALIACGCLALTLTGCNDMKPAASQTPEADTVPSINDTYSAIDTTEISARMQAVTLPQIKETVCADDGSTLFSLSFQQIQLTMHSSELEERIADHFQKRTDTLLTYASQIESQARADYPDNEYWSEYFIETSYTPTRLDQTVLSLFGSTSSYSGGTHPSLETDSVTYDLQTGNMLFLDDLLTAECTPDRLYRLVLNSLESQADELYYDYADVLGDRFTGEFHSIQDWCLSRTGLCFHFAPYDIAPYSSGTIIAELPYSTLTGILNQHYFPEELPAATGSIYAETYIEDDSERFEFIADVALCEDGSEILLYPDATVTDLRIESGTLSDYSEYTSGSTVFAASTLSVGEAIHLSADLESKDRFFRLVYRSDSKEYSAFITYDELGDSILLTNG